MTDTIPSMRLFSFTATSLWILFCTSFKSTLFSGSSRVHVMTGEVYGADEEEEEDGAGTGGEEPEKGEEEEEGEEAEEEEEVE